MSQESACFCLSFVVVSLTVFKASVLTKSISWYSVGAMAPLAPTGDLIGCSTESSWSKSMYFNSDSLFSLLPGAGGVVSHNWNKNSNKLVFHFFPFAEIEQVSNLHQILNERFYTIM